MIHVNVLYAHFVFVVPQHQPDDHVKYHYSDKGVADWMGTDYKQEVLEIFDYY